MKRNKLWSVLAVSALIGTLAACGNEADSSGSGDGGDSGDGGTATGAPWILGTTDAVTSIDPAGSYDFGSWNIQYNIFQQLMTVPANGSDPEPDLAESCDYDDPQTITCTLPEGATFSNGDELTSSDVLFSFQRNIEIADPNGSSVLLGSISNGDTDNPGLADGAIETPDDTTVVFHLNQPDQTFMQLLTSATTSIVDEDTFPIDDKLRRRRHREHGRLRPLQAQPVQGGRAGGLRGQRDLPGHQDPAEPAGLRPVLQRPGAAQDGRRGRRGRHRLAHAEPDRPQRPSRRAARPRSSAARARSSATGSGSSSTEVGKDKAIRQAVAQIIDRQAISDNAYDGTVAPSYSIVPPGFGGQKDSFKEKYGEPDVDAAKQILDAAGVQDPGRRSSSATRRSTTARTPSTRRPSWPTS